MKKIITTFISLAFISSMIVSCTGDDSMTNFSDEKVTFDNSKITKYQQTLNIDSSIEAIQNNQKYLANNLLEGMNNESIKNWLETISTKEYLTVDDEKMFVQIFFNSDYSIYNQYIDTQKMLVSNIENSNITLNNKVAFDYSCGLKASLKALALEVATGGAATAPIAIGYAFDLYDCM